jgi:two-component system OmpR family sensor kinase
MTVRARLTVIYATAMLLTLVLAGGVIWWQLRSALRTSLDQALETRAGAVLTATENQGQAGIQESDGTTAPGVFVQIFDGRGQSIDATAGAPAGLRPPPPGVRMAEVVLGSTTYALHIVTGDGGIIVVAGSSLAALDSTLDRLARSLLLVGVLAAAVSLAGGWWLAGRALRPVAVLTAEAAQIGAADVDRRLPVPGQRDELQALAVTLNGMLERVAEALRRQRAFVVAASHDLRTPIATLQAELDLADDARTTDVELREAVRAAHADVVRLGELATALLDLAAADANGRALVRLPVRADHLVDSVVRRVGPLARHRETRITQAAPARLVRVDRVRIEQAMTNIVGNAIAYGPPGSVVEIIARVDDESVPKRAETAAVLTIEVLDRGPGIRPEAGDTLFLPFHRGPNATGPGSGLGLATAAAAIEAHHGAIWFEPRIGGGSRFWFTVPA